jgi:hypothetical protein
MANLTQHLITVSPDLRSGPSLGHRLLALVLCSMLVLASVLPGVALAGEADSEGEGSAPSIELPAPPDFDPGGEEAAMEEVPATGEEAGAVEIESEGDIEASPPEEVTSAATEAPVEAAPPQPVAESASPAPAPVQQQVAEPPISEPVANQSIVAPKQKPIERRTASQPAASSEAPPPVEPAERKVPPPQPVTATPADSSLNLVGKDFYVVQPGDCLSHIAQALLPAGADDTEIASKVTRLWRLNEDRIGTGDPDLIYPGTVLRLR